MRFWSFIGAAQLYRVRSPNTHVFPPRSIQKARHPTGPSLRRGKYLAQLIHSRFICNGRYRVHAIEDFGRAV
jgi:hypothetical protein